MRVVAGILGGVLIALAMIAGAAEQGIIVKGVRYFSYPTFTRIVFETEAAAPYVLTRSGDGRSLSFTSFGGLFGNAVSPLPVVNDGVVRQLEARQDGDRQSIVILLGPSAGEAKDFVLRGPDRVVVDIQRGAAPAAQARPAAAVAVVVLDAGHGGQQTGLVTGQGVEKSQTLELAQAIRNLLRKAPIKMTVLLTREADQGLTLDERAAAANAAEASVFVSVHMADGPASRVFILDPDEGQVSAVAAGGPADFLGYDAVSEQQQTLWGAQQARHAAESGRLGRALARSLSPRADAEPSQAPLALLKPVDAAAALVEVGMGGERAKAAEAISRGIEQYVRDRR